jgi:hypothetical protein
MFAVLSDLPGLPHAYIVALKTTFVKEPRVLQCLNAADTVRTIWFDLQVNVSAYTDRKRLEADCESQVDQLRTFFPGKELGYGVLDTSPRPYGRNAASLPY